MTEQDNTNNQIYHAPGNRFNLRSQSWRMIKRISGLSHMGSITDFLVTTWLGILVGLGILGIGLYGTVFIIKQNDMQTLWQNLGIASIYTLGVFFIAFNALLTNPSHGLQIIVSMKFLIHKLIYRKLMGFTKLKNFRIWPGDESQSIIEQNIDGKSQYISIFRTRGIVSPVSFEEEKAMASTLNKQMLTNLEDDTLVIKMISIEDAEIKPKPIPPNATPAMVKKINEQYLVTTKKKDNRQLQTTLFLVAPTPAILNSRIQTTIRAMEAGLVMNYSLLCGEEAKKAIAKILK
ncbi:hypothetical protein [uncultured Lactobacillus sp.]|uniref:hypothetical protein n=1 Tax=uncultured Lactobacillus sp. TaxID=153152 RepID=UPI00158005AB|nr:hypothetical protein [uncultured Lactobacillus sp.]NUF98973.1 hypothetical protein [Bombilactobacillus mellis]